MECPQKEIKYKKTQKSSPTLNTHTHTQREKDTTNTDQATSRQYHFIWSPVSVCFWTRREGRNQLSSKTVFSHLLSVLKNRPRSTEQGGLVGDDDWLAGCQFQVQFTGPHRTSTSAVVSCSSCSSIKDAIGSVSRPPRNEIWAAQSWGPREFPCAKRPEARLGSGHSQWFMFYFIAHNEPLHN